MMTLNMNKCNNANKHFTHKKPLAYLIYQAGITFSILLYHFRTSLDWFSIVLTSASPVVLSGLKNTFYKLCNYDKVSLNIRNLIKYIEGDKKSLVFEKKINGQDYQAFKELTEEDYCTH